MSLKDEYKVGQEFKVWSVRVMGVPVHFTITKVGSKLLHGTFRTMGRNPRNGRIVQADWEGAIMPERIVERL